MVYNNELIKELDKKLEVTKEEIIGGTMYIYCETKRQNTKCKYCSKESQSVHSTYTRTIADLPIQNYKVKLIITVKKYFCNNDKCNHRTFAETLEFVEKNAIRTKRLDDYINNTSRLKGIRQEARTNIKYLKRSKIKKLLFYDIEEIKDENLKNDLREYLETNKELSELFKMIRKFKEIIFSKKPQRLKFWIEKAKKINVKELNSFITLIESDIDAVKNAIKYDYSNGLIEGFNNKTKVIKRIMYGRCSFDLLRLKILS